jgi:transposase-like protein
MQKLTHCPRCQSQQVTKSGIINNRQRYRCKDCSYHFTVNKLGKQISNYYVTKALQLYIEGLSYREIERILGISHVTIMNLVKRYAIRRPEKIESRPTYKVLNHRELVDFVSEREQLSGAGLIITELGDKFMLIKWERFRE